MGRSLPCYRISLLVMQLCLDFTFPFFFFFLRFFDVDPFLKSLLDLLQYCFCFMFWFFGPKACWILVPWPGIHNVPPALEGKILTTGPPEKSYDSMFQSSCHPPHRWNPGSHCLSVFTSLPPSHCPLPLSLLKVHASCFLGIGSKPHLTSLWDSNQSSCGLPHTEAWWGQSCRLHSTSHGDPLSRAHEMES